MLTQFPYVQTPMRTGTLDADCLGLLTENGKPKTAAHCLAVKDTCEALCARFHLPQDKAGQAALLHDIAAVLRPPDMLCYAHANGWAIDPSEKAHPFLLHQQVSAVIARDWFSVTDAQVLSAVACHSTLKAAPSGLDMALFLADKLSWDQAGTPPFTGVVEAGLAHSLERACLVYIEYVIDHGMILMPHQWFLDARAWLGQVQ